MSPLLRRSSAFSRSLPRQLSRNSWRISTPLSRRSYINSNSDYNTINSYRQRMNFVYGLIGANMAVFAAVLYSGSSNKSLYSKLRRNLPLSLNNIREGKWWTVVTSGFTHYTPMHIAGNMISLYFFGSILARIPGLSIPRLAGLSLGSLVSGSAVFLMFQNSRERPGRRVEGIGASGMVMGLGAAAACLVPRQTMLIYGIVPVPLWVLISGYFVIDYSSLDSNSGTAHEGHLGGLAFGLLYYVLSLRRFGGILAKRATTAAPRQVWRGRR